MNQLVQRNRVVEFTAKALENFPAVVSPVVHTFTPGLYIRRVLMKAGSLIVSKIHKTEHPYVITRGVVAVWTPDVGTQILRAPYHGITKPDTQRILYIHEDTEWTTYHPTDKKTVAEVEEEIIEKFQPLEQLVQKFNSSNLCLGSPQE